MFRDRVAPKAAAGTRALVCAALLGGCGGGGESPGGDAELPDAGAAHPVATDVPTAVVGGVEPDRNATPGASVDAAIDSPQIAGREATGVTETAAGAPSGIDRDPDSVSVPDHASGGEIVAPPGEWLPPAPAASAAGIRPDGNDGVPASAVSGAALRRAAVENVMRGLDANRRALDTLGADIDTLLARIGIRDGTERDGGLEGAVVERGGTAPGATVGVLAVEDAAPVRERPARGVFDDAAAASEGLAPMLRVLLGSEGDEARVERDGDSLAIDPDDAALCALAPWSSLDTVLCGELAARVAVRLDASTAASGRLSLRFDDVETLGIGYGPRDSIFELALDGYADFLRAAADFVGDPSAAAQAMRGRLRLELGTGAAEDGGERPTLTLAVDEALVVAADDGTRVWLAPSTLLALETDVGAGRVELAVDIGVASLSVPDAASGGLAHYFLPGLVARATYASHEDTLIVSDLRIGHGPLTFAIDAVELARLDVGELGFRLDGRSGRLSLHGDVGAALLVEDLLEGLGARLSARLAAPDGTVVEHRGDGLFGIEEGSLSLELSLVDGTSAGSVDESLSIGSGECAARVDGEPERLLPDTVRCGP